MNLQVEFRGLAVRRNGLEVEAFGE